MHMTLVSLNIQLVMGSAAAVMHVDFMAFSAKPRVHI